MWYKGPIFLPSHIYKMLSDSALNTRKQYNEAVIAKYKGTRAANLQDPTPPDNE